jgi:YbbR domain-containing protein
VLRKVWSVVRRDVGLKLVSVLLALLVWYGAGSKQSVEYNIRIPLEVRNLPSQFILVGDIPETARIRVSGKGRFFKFRMRDVIAFVDASEAEPGLFLRPLTALDVVLPAGTSAEVREVLAPRMVRAEVDRRARRRVPVEPVLAGAAPDGFTMVASPRVSPDSVDVVGPERSVRHLTSARLEDLDLSRIRGEVHVKRRVDLAGLPMVEAMPSEAQVSVVVERLTELQFASVPVRVRLGEGREPATVTPSAVSVRLSGPTSLITAIDPDTLALLIEGAGLEPGTHAFRTDPVGANRVLLLPADTSGEDGADATPASGTRSARLTAPPSVRIVEIAPSHFSISVERAGARRRPS